MTLDAPPADAEFTGTRGPGQINGGPPALAAKVFRWDRLTYFQKQGVYFHLFYPLEYERRWKKK